MAAAGPIIHCVIATRVFRSVCIVYNVNNNINIVCFRVLCNCYFGFKTLLLMPHQMKNKNNQKKRVCRKVQLYLSPHESKFIRVRNRIAKE